MTNFQLINNFENFIIFLHQPSGLQVVKIHTFTLNLLIEIIQKLVMNNFVNKLGV